MQSHRDFFNGQHTSRRRVDLRGRSKAEESRKEVLERTRLEREQRKRQKERNRAATSIQAIWRSKHTLGRFRARLRQDWVAAFGNYGKNATRDDLSLHSSFLRDLCFFCRTSDVDDLQRLASACRLILTSKDSNGRLSFCNYQPGNNAQRALVSHRAKTLLYLCLNGLTEHRVALAQQLRQARQGNAGHSMELVPPLIDTVLMLIGPEAWHSPVGPHQATRISTTIIHHLLNHSAIPNLSRIIVSTYQDVSPVSASPSVSSVSASPVVSASPSASPSNSSAEALTTAVVIRCLTCQPLETQVDRELPFLLCIPMLWQRCRMLSTVSSRMWRRVVSSLSSYSVSDLVSWLPADLLGCKAAAATALFGNLVEVAGQALKSEEQQSNAGLRQLAVRFTRLVSNLLSVIPLSVVLSSPSTSTMEEDEEAPASTSTTHEVLPWLGPLPHPSWQSQLRRVSDASVLSVLIRSILTSASPDSIPATSLADSAAAVRPLCLLLEKLLGIAGQQQRVLISLAVSGQIVQRLWYSYLKQAHLNKAEGWLPSEDETCDPGWMLPLTLLARAYGCFIITAGEHEIYVKQTPLPLTELYNPERPDAGLISLLKWSLWHTLWVETPPLPGSWGEAASARRSTMTHAVGSLMGQLYDLNCRRRFAPNEAFHAESISFERFHVEMQTNIGMYNALGKELPSSRAWNVLRYAPFLVPFQERAQVFQTVVLADRQAQREMDVSSHVSMAPHNFTVIQRNQVLEDGFRYLNPMGEGLKARVRIQFVNEYGVEEAGVDGGGIFKEFLETIIKEGFDPNIALFKATSDQRLYPNPAAYTAVPGATQYFEFLGRMLGKAMYEGILLELPLAGFFLKKFRSAHCDINDLPTLDQELYRSLVYLRDYQGEVADLALTFTITDSELGEHTEVELIPNGRNISVTNSNVIEYIHRVADHRLNQQIKAPSNAFLRGLHDLIPPDWIRMFNEDELQMLISGAQDGLDLDDMRHNVQYSGGYHDQHPVIREFWRALESFTPDEQRGFLKFVTSCSRAPLLGFSYLEPQLCIQMAGSVLDAMSVERLPTAATCMNLLKLPPYMSAAVIKDKLLYAISEGAGFELS